MKFYLDTEFIEDGVTIRLLSLGVVAEDGREMYVETDLAATARDHADRYEDWLRQNVIPYLGRAETSTREEIVAQLTAFVDPQKFGEPEFWGSYVNYDWVAVCQLFGKMVDLPDGWPMHCNDLVQLAEERGSELPPQIADEHWALADARWVRDTYRSFSEEAELASSSAKV